MINAAQSLRIPMRTHDELAAYPQLRVPVCAWSFLDPQTSTCPDSAELDPRNVMSCAEAAASRMRRHGASPAPGPRGQLPAWSAP